MISNERQFRIAGTQMRRFEQALAAHSDADRGGEVAARIFRAIRDAIASERDELRAQLNRYEAVRSGRISRREFGSFRALPVALIEGRIAAQMSQRDLAKRLGIPEQQIQRWEANDYFGVGLERLQEVAEATGLKFRGIVTYDVPVRKRGVERNTSRGRLDAAEAVSLVASMAGEQYLTPAQVADELQVNVVTVRRWIANRELRATKAGPRRWMISRLDLRNFMASSCQPDAEVSEVPSLSQRSAAADER
jgi:excisionase family DNA binding protein